ncbi:MAG: DUF3419 family protein [Alphaproteobacteria bacterium]|nr:DUF3419 family protein [Alphaproteobacteria bacterium]
MFLKAFASLFVYNILFEDSEIDERFLDLDEDSAVLGISGAGCGLATMLSRRPARVDAVDINRHHLALAALKMRAAVGMPHYSSFYDLFGRGWSVDPARQVQELSQDLPPWMQRYWKRHHVRFRRSLYRTGVTAQTLGVLRSQIGVDSSWMRWVIGLDAEQRIQAIDDWFGPFLRRPAIKALLDSPFQLIAMGVNHEQLERMLAADALEDLGRFFLMHIQRLVLTDLETNWFAWYFVTGQFDHDNAACAPPYLRREHHERSLGATTDMRFHNHNLFEVLGEAGRDTWSHYNFLDAPDWMPEPAQRRLLEEVVRTGREGAILLHRSVEEANMVERTGMLRHFEPMPEATAFASANDRTRQYKRVVFHRLVA